MIAKPLFSLLTCFSSTLLLAGTAQAQGLFGVPFFSPYNPQPRYVSPCGPNGCPTNVNYGCVPRTNCPGGVCNAPRYDYSSNYAPRGYGMINGVCGPSGCSTGSCANGSCSTRFQNYPSYPGSGWSPSTNGGMRTMPYDDGYQTRTRPMPAAPQLDYNSNRPRYDDDELPARVAPPAYLDPRSNPYYGASRNDRYDTATVDRPRPRLETDRSPFYP